MAEAKAGLEMVKSEFTSAEISDKLHWFTPPPDNIEVKNPTIHLLPNFDELFVAYKDHRGSFDAAVLKDLTPGNEALLNYVITLNGQVIGGWRRTIEKRQISITTNLLITLNEAEQIALKMAAEDYGRFMGLPITVV
jgi:hypothetical protein